MAVLYTTVARSATAEEIIEKSRFIANMANVSSKDEAEAFISAIRAQYKDATHNVPAYIIGDKMQIQWGSDDGEPGGTAGTPIVQMLQKEGITNVVCVVTRYFGGIKLGTGGLVRAYTGCAKLALEKAGRYDVKEYITKTIEIPYSNYDMIKYQEGKQVFRIKNSTFSENIFVEIEYEKDDEGAVNAVISGLRKR